MLPTVQLVHYSVLWDGRRNVVEGVFVMVNYQRKGIVAASGNGAIVATVVIVASGHVVVVVICFLFIGDVVRIVP